jgi:WD40 repeat protein
MSFLLATTLAALALAADAAPPIVAVAIAPGRTGVVAASQAGVQVFSLPQLEPVRALQTQLSHVHDVAFSRDGKTLAIAGGAPAENGRVELWEWPAGIIQATIACGGDVAYSARFNPDGTRLVVACADKKVRVLNAAGEGKTLECHSAAVLAAAWLPADNLLLSAGIDQSIRVLDPATGDVRRSLDNHTAAVRDLAIRPGEHDGPLMVASCGADRTVRLWQPTIGRLVRFVRLPSGPTAVCWTPSGSHGLAACEDGRLRSIDPTSLEVIEFAQRLDGWAHAVAPLPDGSAAILAGAGGQLRIVRLDAIKP